SDGRLDKVKVGLHTMIDHLLDEDRLAIVEFDDQVDVDATFGATLDRTKLHAIVDRLTPRGATDIFDGLQQGFQLLGDVPASDHQNRVIFLSDGLATAGDTSQDHIMQMAKERVQRGIGLTTIGVGDEFDVALMRGLAEQGAGNFYFLEDAAAASEVFTEELDYFMQPIALDVRLDATAGPGYRFGEVVGSRLWLAEAASGSMQIPAVFVASRTSQSGGTGRRGGGSMIFIHMTPIDGNTGRAASITLSYRTPGSEVRTQQTVVLDYANDPTITPEPVYLSTPEMAERFAMYNMFLGIRAATQATDLGCARSVLEATRAGASAWNTTHEDPDIQADLVLVDQYLANIGEHLGSGYDGTARPIGSCPTAIGPDGPPLVDDPMPVDYVDDSPRYHGLVCSTGSPTASLPIVLAAIAVAGLRRRRRR
ncbi:MAG TPA: VWA domain-containing protein, partial [Kofleriaceae bacterium]|nr:VWA domain-containing protein [Kofleriaceae bacterium]